MVGEIVNTVRSKNRREHCCIGFRFGFSNSVQEWHDSNGGLGEDVAWRHGISQTLRLPLPDVIAKSRMINSGFNFMLDICAWC